VHPREALPDDGATTLATRVHDRVTDDPSPSFVAHFAFRHTPCKAASESFARQRQEARR
jgi:hypothetical protein